MQLGMIGLGRMGANMVRRLLKGGHHCVVFDRSAPAVAELVKEKAIGAGSLAEFVKQLAALKLDTIRGPVSIDDMRNPVQNIYIKKVEKKKMFGYDKDELWNTVVKTYNDVSTYWQYDPAKFRAQPVYSRDFPPCKYCE